MTKIFYCVLGALLALMCRTETTTTPLERSMLHSTIKLLHQFNLTVKQTDTSFFTPNRGIEDCCSQSALDCFQSQIVNIASSNKDMQCKLKKNLRKSTIVNGVNRCTEKQRQEAQCASCKSYKQTDSQEFLENLLILLQKSYSRLNN